jgi:hypothetical protein
MTLSLTPKILDSAFCYDRNTSPFGKSWEEWAAVWYRWMLSTPKNLNPCLDSTGKYCSVNQNNKKVWFLAGTFGNTALVRRKCIVPLGKAIFFPVLVKEDSFKEDVDLKTRAELISRSKDATDQVLNMKATVDGQVIEHIEQYRVQSKIFKVRFPTDNVYDVTPGETESVCDGFWLFLKPLGIGRHIIYFKGETYLAETYTKNLMRKLEAYSLIRQHVESDSLFRVEVLYDLAIKGEGEK